MERAPPPRSFPMGGGWRDVDPHPLPPPDEQREGEGRSAPSLLQADLHLSRWHGGVATPIVSGKHYIASYQYGESVSYVHVI